MQPLHLIPLVCGALLCLASTKDKPHPHNGHLIPFDGRHISYNVTKEQSLKLAAGQPVTYNERSGRSGRGFSLQDVAAPPHICMDRISDLAHYPKVVPKLKKIQLYDEEVFANGTSRTGAYFEIGTSFFSMGYYLLCTYEPKYQTFTWVMDYRYSSDFEDSTGHWQVLPHPTKEGWSRVLYSTELQLTPWIPEFVITMLTKTALVESTGWVKLESEKLASSPAAEKVPFVSFPDLSACFVETETNSLYLAECFNGPVAAAAAASEDKDIVENTISDSNPEL